MLVHVSLDFLAEALEFGVLDLELLLLGLEHWDHIKPDLDFLSFGQFELTLDSFFRRELLGFLLSRYHLVKCPRWVTEITTF